MSLKPTSPFMYGYFKWVSIISMVVIVLYGFLSLYSAYLLVSPPFKTIDDFTYGSVKDGMAELMLKEENRYVLHGITEENFDEKREYLYRIVKNDQDEESPGRVWSSLAYLALYVLVFFMHYRRWKGSCIPERSNKFDEKDKT